MWLLHEGPKIKHKKMLKLSFSLHCKWNGCTQYSFWQCYVCHCILAVHKAADDCAQSMAVLNLNCSQKKDLSGFFCFCLYKHLIIQLTLFESNKSRPLLLALRVRRVDNFHKLSGEKFFLKIEQLLTKLETNKAG